MVQSWAVEGCFQVIPFQTDRSESRKPTFLILQVGNISEFKQQVFLKLCSDIIAKYSTAHQSIGRMMFFDLRNIDVKSRKQCKSKVNLGRKGKQFLWYYSNNFTKQK